MRFSRGRILPYKRLKLKRDTLVCLTHGSKGFFMEKKGKLMTEKKEELILSREEQISTDTVEELTNNKGEDDE